MVLTVATEHAVGHAVAVDVVFPTIGTLLDARMDLRQTGLPRIRVWAPLCCLSATVTARSVTLTVGVSLPHHSLVGKSVLLLFLHLGWRRAAQGGAVALLLAEASVLAACNAMHVDVIVPALQTIAYAVVDLVHAHRA